MSKSLLALLLTAWFLAVAVAGRTALDSRDATTQGMLPSFVALSIEMSSFRGFAGTKHNKNKVTQHLIKHLSEAQNAPMAIRVGGRSA
ncbi:hypothetical protein E4U54_005891, partial [Claviceps lovelessii]